MNAEQITHLAMRTRYVADDGTTIRDTPYEAARDYFAKKPKARSTDVTEVQANDCGQILMTSMIRAKSWKATPKTLASLPGAEG